ncbi:chaperone protein DnaJ [Prunus yedoensis var. nudiflora]|uniref:Chaperone protein DnaJ n=1 Tax=Prunus yedoensis var. nudiflora TaxID=2094558 RepID=A0A314UPY1_PRUYE|nr:chaperone protein DnaJ [Prunus yedoensis var. nudiflora]
MRRRIGSRDKQREKDSKTTSGSAYHIPQHQIFQNSHLRISQTHRHQTTSMMWDEWDDANFSHTEQQQQPDPDSHLNFDFFSDLSKPKDYYKILEVDYDANDDAIRSNYIRLALKWHPDKQKDEDSANTRYVFPVDHVFVNLAEGMLHKVLSDPVKRREYDKQGMLYVYDYNVTEYLNRYKGLILTCNGLGIRHSIW